MTTIAYDGKRIATDSQACWGEVRSPVEVSKIWFLKNESRRVVVAGAGNPTTLMELARLFIRYLPEIRGHHALIQPPSFPRDFGGSIIALDVETGRVFHMGDDATCVEVTGKLAACGSGREFALGAMYSGAGAAGAVSAAVKFDPYSGGEIQWFMVGENLDTANWVEMR